VARNFDIVCELGRILLQELDDGRCHISCEVVGYPSEPMTTQRTAIFNPSGLELTRQMEAAMGTAFLKMRFWYQCDERMMVLTFSNLYQTSMTILFKAAEKNVAFRS
jgi:hypothetical protein